ncbi:aspartate kinase [Fibrella sp. HMF5335]|uniref:Aspartokinase n=1 Tax=Fibrella rubiginis TaxID=2817060 RepID=A0A939GF56_9BACT|nr:aspartate kinase [Fibrella rubiginis]
MKIFKFGGASVRDAAGVRNLASILQSYAGQSVGVVISAMGKTTNALETVVDSYWAANTSEALDRWTLIENNHLTVSADLGLSAQEIAPVQTHLDHVRSLLQTPPVGSYDQVYDQLVSTGEILSTQLVTAYLLQQGLPARWTDARQLIRTDATFREGRVDWTVTEQQVRAAVNTAHGESSILITQGFIGSTHTGETTTLGREGSDYTAAILAYCLDAQDVTIWKDVPGVLNADPKYFDDTVLLTALTYQDATELAYYGATVIHPKTIKPLQNKGIPLYVRSFLQPTQPGTVVGVADVPTPVASFIFKVNQWLISLHPTDFSFITEDNLSLIFGEVAAAGLKINLMQQTALNFSFVVDNRPDRIETLFTALRPHFRVNYNEGLELITIRYYNQATIDRVLIGKTLLLEQKSRTTVQLVVREKSSVG